MNTINPNIAKYFTLDFQIEGTTIYSVPTLLFCLIARQQGIDPTSDKNEVLSDLMLNSDLIAKNDPNVTSQSDCIQYLKDNIRLNDINKYIQYHSCHEQILKEFWTSQSGHQIDLRFTCAKIPDTIYKYMPFKEKRIDSLIRSGNIYLSPPSRFNDPFDCSLDEEIRLTFIESAVGCFTTDQQNILMYSHYADNHQGICIGFNTALLLKSLSEMNAPLKSDIRPVWYYRNAPPFTLAEMPALCATAKQDIWSYEREYRLFMIDGGSLKPSGVFRYDPKSISKIIMGCKSNDETIAKCKSLAYGLDCKFIKANKVPGNFEVNFTDIM